jgi:hypothetical protein
MGTVNQSGINWLGIGQSLFSGIASIASGGWPAWAAAGGLIILLFIGYLWLKKKINEAIHKESETKQGQDLGGTKPVSGGTESGWDQAHKTTDEVRNQNPDGGKPPRPTV